jgi:hypothetical protein
MPDRTKSEVFYQNERDARLRPLNELKSLTKRGTLMWKNRSTHQSTGNQWRETWDSKVTLELSENRGNPSTQSLPLRKVEWIYDEKIDALTWLLWEVSQERDTFHIGQLRRRTTQWRRVGQFPLVNFAIFFLQRVSIHCVETRDSPR